MDDRIHRVNAWYNRQIDINRAETHEFNQRFADETGKVDLTAADPEVVKHFGAIERETQILDVLGDLLSNEFPITIVPDDLSDLDEA